LNSLDVVRLGPATVAGFPNASVALSLIPAVVKRTG
jgi:hypothetical protein